MIRWLTLMIFYFNSLNSFGLNNLYHIASGESITAQAQNSKLRIILNESHSAQILSRIPGSYVVMVYNKETGKPLSDKPFLVDEVKFDEIATNTMEAKLIRPKNKIVVVKPVLIKPIKQLEEIMSEVEDIASLKIISGNQECEVNKPENKTHLREKNKSYYEDKFYANLKKLRTHIGQRDMAILKNRLSGKYSLNELKRIKNKVFTYLYSDEFTHEDRNMIGAIWTTFGEARGANDSNTELDPRGRAEMASVMYSLKNRVFDKKGPKSLLDIAIQPYQYSMYNTNDPNWVRFLVEADKTGDNKNALDRGIRAYTDFNDPRFKIEMSSSRGKAVTHYYTKNIKKIPNWSDLTREEKLKVHLPPPPKNGVIAEPKSHLFFSDIAWSYQEYK